MPSKRKRYVATEDRLGWITPFRRGYRIMCCDCGLVHEMDFRVDERGEIQFRVRRHNRATAAARRRPQVKR